MAYNYVAPATRADGTGVVLKCGVPNPELVTEIHALQAFNGKGTVQLLDAKFDVGAMLLERLDPGRAILHLQDDESATGEAIQLMRDLQTIPEDSNLFPSVADWAMGLDRLRSTFGGGTGPFPESLVEIAEGKSQELLPFNQDPVLLHGDLHHRNILSAQRAPWLAIDPKGVIGDPAYETGAWIRNPFPDLLSWPNAREIISRRIDQFSNELGLDQKRIEGWSVYQAVLAAWWSYEEGGDDWEGWLVVAELMI
jgi:streptomycin 6-kinase